jgi:uncharacterized protein (DUF2147 family)
LAMVLLSVQVSSAEPPRPGPIDGVWLDQDRSGYIQIERDGESWQGRIAGSVAGKVEKDVKNPDPALRDRSLLGQRIIRDLRCDTEVCLGSIYNPRDGRMYSARVRLLEPDVLEVRGYIGTPLLGQSQKWTRVKDRKAPGLQLDALVSEGVL